jgi:hypothetical protein
MYGTKSSKKFSPMKQLKGFGLGRQGYSAQPKKAPKGMAAQPTEPATLRMKTLKQSKTILVPKQETKSISY